MWIQGYSSLINTKSVRAVFLLDPSEWEVEGIAKWQLVAAFHGLDARFNKIIAVYDTEKEAIDAQARLFIRLQQRPAKGIGLDKDWLAKIGGDLLGKVIQELEDEEVKEDGGC